MSRLLSMTLNAACVCHQSIIVQRALNVAERLVLVRFAQTQPAAEATTQPHLYTNNTDPSISVFHRPSKITVDCSDISEKADHATMHCRYSGANVDVCFNENLKTSLHDVQQRIRDEAFCNETVRVESVDELLSREVKPTDPHLSLPRLYSKLAKLRLTGTYCDFILFASCVF